MQIPSDMLNAFLTHGYPALLTALLLIVCDLYIRETGHRHVLLKLREAWHFEKLRLFFWLYTAFVAVATVLSRPLTNPFIDVIGNFLFIKNANYTEAIENILLFVPVTLLMLPAFRPRRPFLTALLTALGGSMCIECSQLLFHLGEFQLADLCNNTLGGLIGWGIWYIGKKCLSRSRNRYE